MIKKILLVVLCGLLIYGIYSAVRNGLVLGTVEVPSYQSLVDGNNTIDEKVASLNTLNTSTYPAREQRLQSAKSDFASAKREYDNLASTASTEEIAEANKKEQYMLDFLWMKIGTYANNDSVKIFIDPEVGTPIINFSVSGPYIAVVNFIYDLENDADLSFNIDNIVMQGGSSDEVTKASFVVTGINIITTSETD